ncbi:hypothetical protein AMQ83_10140 [Paenibacillus riograndensis]|nr:hypothetical protein AMQ83_10140 [Paenibacillus riograndensis]
MSNNVKRITAYAAALLLCLAPAAAFAENAAGSTPATAPDSAVRAEQNHRHPHPPGTDKDFRAGGGDFIISETSKLLEMDRHELIRSLKSGTTLYALAKEKKGWSEEQYLQKLSEAAVMKLETSIKDGRLTQGEAEKMKAGLPAVLKLGSNRIKQLQQSLNR